MSPTSSPPVSSAWGSRLAVTGLILLLLAAYHNSFGGPFVLDDGPAIVHNASIRRLWPLTGVLFPKLDDAGVTVSGRPLVNLSLALNYAVGGESVTGYHGVNLLIHAAAGLLLLGVVRRTLLQAPLTGRLGPVALPLAWTVAALWALHPLQTAAVSYIIQRAEALMSLFYLLTLYGFIRAAELQPVGRDRLIPPGNNSVEPGHPPVFALQATTWQVTPGSPKPWRRRRPGRWNDRPEGGPAPESCGGVRRPRPTVIFWSGLSVAACFAGMACKEVMVTAPVIVLLYDRTFVAGGFREAWRQRWKYYLALAGSWLLLGGLVAGTAGRGGTAGFAVVVSPWEYALTQCQAIVHYLRLVFWPHPLVFDYGIATVGGLAEVWWQALLLLVLAAGVALALFRRPVPGFAGVWFFALLAPSSSFVPVATQTMAEHRMYLALAAPVCLLVLALHKGLGRWAWPAVGILTVAGGMVTHARNADYATAHGLWADTVAKRPTNARAYHNLGLAEEARGRFAEAEGLLRRAVALAPGTPEPLYNLALVLTRLDRPAEAMAFYQDAIRLDPDYAAAHNNVANLLLAAGRSEEAGRHYAEAVRAQPDFAGARNSYGVWLIDAGRATEALAQLEEAIRLQPEMAEMHFNAGNACAALGRMATAADYYRAAIRLQPNHAEAHNNLGNILLELDRLPEALGEFEAAVRLQPDYFAPRRTMALLLLMHLHRPAEARAHLEILVRLRPGDAEIAQALVRARAGGG